MTRKQGSGIYPRKPLDARFWAGVNKLGPVHPTLGRCWSWGSGVRRGSICFNYKLILAYRVSWEIHNGPIPEGSQVLHRCDNGNCVNPNHLFLGTQKDNMHDCSSKGRLNPGKPDNRGERNGQATLTAEDVAIIKRLHKPRGKGEHSAGVLALRFGVSAQHVNRIARGLRWNH